jgi:hypothetical protein
MDILLLNLAKWLAALAIPAALAMFVPRPWLVAALVTWALLPLIVLLVLFIGEILHNPSELTQPGETRVAFLFWGGLLTVPWFVVSAIGYAIGLALRRRDTRGAAVTARPALPPKDAPVRAVVSPRLSQWRARHVGFERDGFILDGLDIWGSEWRRLGTSTPDLPHPAHPHELHRFRICEAGEGPQTRQFAATELSNGVWGFYTPIGADKQRAGTSANGSIRFENEFPGPDGEARERIAPTGRIWRVATGEMLADGSAWISSEVIPEANGSLLFALRHFGNDALFRLHPETGTFSVVGELRPDQPIDRLGDTVASTMQTITDRAHRNLGLQLSPDGSIRVELAAKEWSNTHWVNAPRVIEVASGRILLDLWGTDWDAGASFPLDRCVSLALQRYHFGGSCQAMLLPATDQFVVFEDAPEPPARGPLSAIVPALEAAARRSSARAPRSTRRPQRVGPRQLLVAPAILVGALAAIGTISFVAVRLAPEPNSKLTTMPEMPHR